jgi:hypothetical protein
MLGVTFHYPAGSVRHRIYERGGTKAYNPTNTQFDGRNEQTCPIPATSARAENADDAHDFTLAIPDLTPGEYEIRVWGDRGSRVMHVFFAIITVGGERRVIVHGQQYLPDTAPATEPIAPRPSPVRTPPRADKAAVSTGPKLTVGDETLTVVEWGVKLGINPFDIYARLAAGCTVEQALAVTSRRQGGPTGDRAGRAIEFD